MATNKMSALNLLTLRDNEQIYSGGDEETKSEQGAQRGWLGCCCTQVSGKASEFEQSPEGSEGVSHV